MKAARPLARLLAALAASTMVFAGTALAQKTQLTVYTALETDQLKAYQEGFNKAYPDIELVWVRDSTGVITAKLLAEKANPKADVVMGVAATSMGIFGQFFQIFQLVRVGQPVFTNIRRDELRQARVCQVEEATV